MSFTFGPISFNCVFLNKLVTNLIKKKDLIKKNKKKKKTIRIHNALTIFFPQNLLVFIVISKLGSSIYILFGIHL
jgi:hypothetical protein